MGVCIKKQAREKSERKQLVGNLWLSSALIREKVFDDLG